VSVWVETTDDFETCFQLRRVVFIDEQDVPIEEEIDEYDRTAIHLLARDESGPVGTARIVVAGDTAKIGRVCVLATARGRGVGAALIRKALEIAGGLEGVTQAKLGAQVQAIGFYAALGFDVSGPTYLDAGIEHRDMARSVP
jgi:predicted GNAT family N-acyltransferase